jgi:large subunit ribosomal protein L23
MKKFHYLDVIVSPNITEKSTALSEFNKVVFKVNIGASKDSIKRSIEKIFKVNVTKVNTIKVKGKTKIIKNKKSTKSSYKKAIITLKKGQSIDLATGI